MLNRNIVEGRFVWADRFEADLGLSFSAFQSFMFGSGRFADVLVGRCDLRDLVAEWLTTQEGAPTADAFLAYWFEKDAHPCAEVGGLLDRVTCRSVIATNNEARRAAYIMDDMGYRGRVERIFAAGPMGVAKPDGGFFEVIETWSGLPARRILLVDDLLRNVDAARKRGWQAFYLHPNARGDLEKLLSRSGLL